jgi:hypothetical protein
MTRARLVRLLSLLMAFLAPFVSGKATNEDDTSGFVEVPVCLMVPLFGAPSDDGMPPALFPSGIHMARGLLLGVRHVNALDCSVLGSGCSSALLDGSADGRRLRLLPLLYNLEDGLPQSAPPLVQACAATEAQVIAGVITSSQASLVASFVGGLGT